VYGGLQQAPPGSSGKQQAPAAAGAISPYVLVVVFIGKIIFFGSEETHDFARSDGGMIISILY
jgi:hypothetical protein